MGGACSLGRRQEPLSTHRPRLGWPRGLPPRPSRAARRLVGWCLSGDRVRRARRSLSDAQRPPRERPAVGRRSSPIQHDGGRVGGRTRGMVVSPLPPSRCRRCTPPQSRVSRDDEKLVLQWDRPYWHADSDVLALHPTGSRAVPWSTGEQVIRELVRQVGDWLHTNVGDVFEWVTDQSLGTPLAERASFLTGQSQQRLAEILGLDDGLGDLGLDEESDPAASPELQVLRDLSPSISDDVGGVLRELSRQSRLPDHDGRLARNSARSRATRRARARRPRRRDSKRRTASVDRSASRARAFLSYPASCTGSGCSTDTTRSTPLMIASWC